MAKQRKHRWTQDDMRIYRDMKQFGIKNLPPADKARLNFIFSYETGLP
jgi:hypothetical protein